jgi:hypothetical protein
MAAQSPISPHARSTQSELAAGAESPAGGSPGSERREQVRWPA